jgi:cobalamin synthase
VSLLPLARALGDWPSSIALRESLFVWPLLESAHVLTLMLFAGTAAMLDLRLLGAGFRSVPASQFTDRLLPWTRFAFLVMTITGVALVYSNPVRYYLNLFFRVKVILLVLAGLNIWWFHARTHRTIEGWQGDVRPPKTARLAAIISLTAWTGVIVAGRMVAYNWFDCDLQPQSAFVNWAAGCPVGTPE